MLGVGLEQLWRHGHDYVFPEKFAAIEPGKVYRGAWQKDWPMRRIVREHGIRTVVALAHGPENPMTLAEKALCEELGVRFVHLPIASDRRIMDQEALNDRLDAIVEILTHPANQPAFFHCHHGLNRASMVHMAYRMKANGWTPERAREEARSMFGLVEEKLGNDHKALDAYYRERIAGVGGSGGAGGSTGSGSTGAVVEGDGFDPGSLRKSADGGD